MRYVKRKEKTVLQRIGNVVASIFLILAVALLILAIYTMVQSKNDPKNAFLFGYKPVVVETGSMSPYIMEDSVVIIHKSDFAQVKIGDVITYETSGQFVTHRAIAMANNRITVQGDNNDAPDLERVTPENFVGTADYRMNWLQPIISGFEEKPIPTALRYIVIPLALILLLYFFIMMVVKFVKAKEK